MNPNRPSSSDETPRLTPSEVEQRLKRLQPRMPDLDVDAILDVERAKTSPTQLVDRAPISDRSETRFGWYALTWASGAVAGALLTVAFLAPWNSSGAPIDEAEQAKRPGERAPSLASDAGQARSPRRSENTTSPIPIAPDPSSRNEWMVSSWLVELRAPGSTQNRTLMAGDYTLQSELGPTDEIVVTVDADDLIPDDSRSYRPSEEVDMQPALSTNADRLLRELLGEPVPTRM